MQVETIRDMPHTRNALGNSAALALVWGLYAAMVIAVVTMSYPAIPAPLPFAAPPPLAHLAAPPRATAVYRRLQNQSGRYGNHGGYGAYGGYGA